MDKVKQDYCIALAEKGKPDALTGRRPPRNLDLYDRHRPPSDECSHRIAGDPEGPHVERQVEDEDPEVAEKMRAWLKRAMLGHGRAGADDTN